MNDRTIYLPEEFDYFWDYCLDHHIIGFWFGDFDFIHINVKRI